MTQASAPTLGDLTGEGAAYLEERSVPAARFDAEVLLAHAMGLDRSALLPRLREGAAAPVVASFRGLLERRGRRIPLQHLTGHQEFWSLDFQVDGRVLIPRPETELLVETAIAMASLPSFRVADIGTGSGNIAIALARELPQAEVWATDISAAALEVARANAARHGVETRIVFLEGDLGRPLEGEVRPGGLDLLVSNPPYVGQLELAALAPEVRDHEPRSALVPPGGEPLALYPALLAAGRKFLRSGGHLILELPAGGAEKLPPLLRAAGELDLVEVRTDYSGIPRILVVRRR